MRVIGVTGVQTCALPLFTAAIHQARQKALRLVERGVDETERLLPGLMDRGGDDVTRAVRRLSPSECAALRIARVWIGRRSWRGREASRVGVVQGKGVRHE